MGQSDKAGDARILVVDDCSDNRSIIRFYLEQSGYQVMLADGGQAALALLETTAVDMVLLDVMMPGMDGYQVLEKIRNRFSPVELPVIMSTSLSDSQDVVKALNLGANDYILKPIEPAVTEARIQTHLNLRAMAIERDRLLDMTTHDIRKPVMVIEEITNAIKNDYPETLKQNDDLYDLFRMLEKTASRLNHFVTDFLDMRVIENGAIRLNKSMTSLNRIVSETVSKLETIASGKEISLQMQLQSELPETEIDENRIMQVMDNLIGNAIKFSPYKKEIIVSTELIDDSLVCRIKDQGPGLQPDDMNKLFTRFARLSNRPTANEASSGLGLSICKELIDLHDGTISACNNPEQGCSFWFSLPVSVRSLANTEMKENS